MARRAPRVRRAEPSLAMPRVAVLAVIQAPFRRRGGLLAPAESLGQLGSPIKDFVRPRGAKCLLDGPAHRSRIVHDPSAHARMQEISGIIEPFADSAFLLHEQRIKVPTCQYIIAHGVLLRFVLPALPMTHRKRCSRQPRVGT